METEDAAARATSAHHSRAAIISSSNLQVLASAVEHVSLKVRNVAGNIGCVIIEEDSGGVMSKDCVGSSLHS